MEATLTELQQISEGIASTSVGDFETMRTLLQRRAQTLDQIAAMPPDHRIHVALQQAAGESQRLHVLIQAERRRLCLEAAALRNQQRLLMEIRDTDGSQAR